MNITRTTLRLNPHLKKAAQDQAAANNTTLQEILNLALEDYLNRTAKHKAREIMFKTHDLGEPLDNLRRSDFYNEP